MARTRYIVAYDIVDDKRRSKASKRLESYGDRIQYSVFSCDLNGRELVSLRSTLASAINQREDQVIFIALGPADGGASDRVTVLGKPPAAPSRARIV